MADAGPDTSVECSAPGLTSVTLSGLGSFDPDDDPIIHTWTGGFPEGAGTVDGATPTVSFDLGTHSIVLVVSDGIDDSEPDSVEVSVTDTTPPEVARSRHRPHCFGRRTTA